MAKIDFWERHNDLRNEILSEIAKIVGDGEVAVPYYYDEETNADVMKELEEDYLEDEDYDISEGNPYDNVEFEYVDEYDCLHTARLISVRGKDVLADVGDKIDRVNFADIVLTGLINIYEAIAE